MIHRLSFIVSLFWPIAYLLISASFLWWSPERSKEFRELSHRASVALEKRMWNEALIALEGMKRRYPTNPIVRLNLSYLYREVGLLQKARENAQWALDHISRQKKDSARRCLAWVNFQMNLYEEALSALFEIENKTSSDLALEARLWIKKGNWDKALLLLEELPSDNLQANFWKSWCLFKKGDLAALDKIFSLSKGELGLWTVLSHWAAQALKNEKVDVKTAKSLKKPRDLDISQEEAWRLIEYLSHAK